MGYKLKIGSASPASFDSLGISEAILEADIEARSSLTLKSAGSLSSTPIISPFQQVLLLDDSDTVRFAGWLDEAPRSAQGNRQTVSYKLNGPHRWLARAEFEQNRGGLVILGGSATNAPIAPLQLSAAIAMILSAALLRYPSTFGYSGHNVFSHQIPSRLRADVDCFTALLSLVSFAPGMAMWWSYEATNPVLNFASCLGSATKTLSTVTHEISEAELNPRFDLLADAVKVYFLRNNVVSSSQEAIKGGDALALGADRTVIYTYDTSALNSIPESGIAWELAAWHQTLHIDGSAKRQSIDWEDRPGHTYGFTGSDLQQFSSFKTVLHTISRNLFAETTTMRFGVIPNKLLFKVSDLDQGPTASASTHAGISTVPLDLLSEKKTVTVDSVADLLRFSYPHNLVTGDSIYVGSTGTLPAANPQIVSTSPYYVRAVAADAVSLHLSKPDAESDLNKIDLINSGSGTIYVVPATSPFSPSQLPNLPSLLDELTNFKDTISIADVQGLQNVLDGLVLGALNASSLSQNAVDGLVDALSSLNAAKDDLKSKVDDLKTKTDDHKNKLDDLKNKLTPPTDTETPPEDQPTYEPVEVERCDGKKMTVLGTGWS